MSCIIDNGIYTLPCAQIGGVEEVYLGTFNKLYTYSLDADNVIDGVLSGTASLPTLYGFAQAQQTAGLVITPNFSPENLAVSIQSVLSIKVFGLDANNRNQFLLLTKAPVFAVVKSTAGLYYLIGYSNEGRATEGTGGLGIQQLDMNGFSLSFTWNDQYGPFLVDSTILNAIDGIQLINA